jgi:tRNA modification GTPase
MTDTIIALCTPIGTGALALLRVSGPDARTIINKIAQLPAKKQISHVPSHTVHYGSIIGPDHTVLDHVLFIIMDAPRSFTGEHTIEITCHNNPFIIESIINQIITAGARLAQPGEFSKRAFLNKKIDLAQAEAIKELIHANTQVALKKSLAQLEGSFSHYISLLEHDLIRALAWCEASFEFLDDEAEFGTQIKQALEKIITQINTLKKTFDIQQQIRQGIRIALVGSVNAGKSSIFNTLLNQKRSIVTNIAGTTRDVIEAGLYRNGNYWTLIDTAGLRHTDDIIEQEGIKRSFEEAQKADIILLIFDSSRQLTSEEYEIYTQLITRHKNKIIIIKNKIDLSETAHHQLSALTDIAFSCTNQELNTQLENLLEQKIATLFADIQSPFLLNQRQFNLLLALEQKLHEILALFNNTIQYELLSYQLQEALQIISELTGKSISEAGLDMVFKEFCVGK